MSIYIIIITTTTNIITVTIAIIMINIYFINTGTFITVLAIYNTTITTISFTVILI